MPLATEPDTAQLKKALEEVLTGSSFRSSQQCQALLRYIVENSISHREEMLRERVIGANVFGRAPDYDTGNDPVVRSRAAEVRKRLAQHYLQHKDVHDGIRIEIPIGSYRAVFAAPGPRGLDSADPKESGESAAAENLPSEERAGNAPNQSSASIMPGEDLHGRPAIRSRPPRWAAVALAALVLTGAGLLTARQVLARHQRMFETFWGPVMNGRQPALIFIGANHKYGLSKDFLARYRAQHHLENTGSEFFIDLKKGDAIDQSELVPTDALIGFGDVAAAARMASVLTKFNKSYDLRYGKDIAVTDLRSSPAILIGGFSNVWTLELMRQLRFRLEGGDRIVDMNNKARIWVRRSDPETFTGDDYAVISRLTRSETGNFVLVIAGIDTYSNQAAADLLNDPDRLGALLKTLPKGWEQKNMQILLHTGVMKDVPSVVNVEDVNIW